jgi:hypothetical protein
MGLIIDVILTWNHHIDYIAGKPNAACFAIKTVKSLLSREALKILYISYIQGGSNMTGTNCDLFTHK